MSPERRAVLLLIGLAVAGHGARAALAPRGTPPGAITLLGARTAHAALARRDSLAHLARPLADDERIDPDRAGPQELGRLPGVGPGLARRIVEDRARNGPFRSLAGLDRVPGVGARLLERIAPNVAFGGRPADVAELADTGRKDRRAFAASPQAPPARQVRRAPTPRGILSDDPLSPSRPPADPPSSGPEVLNTGTSAELDRLPGIGPARARRIVQFRDSVGPFRSAQDLARVPGISLALARRLWSGHGAP
jgi:competence ComEA-like helix-hairpin-helix protein